MTRRQAEQAALRLKNKWEQTPIIQAYAQGKTIQVRGMKPETNWVDADTLL